MGRVRFVRKRFKIDGEEKEILELLDAKLNLVLVFKYLPN